METALEKINSDLSTEFSPEKTEEFVRKIEKQMAIEAAAVQQLKNLSLRKPKN